MSGHTPWAQVKRRSCPHGDTTCPCQDGDPCHYEGVDPMPCPHVAAHLRFAYRPVPGAQHIYDIDHMSEDDD